MKITKSEHKNGIGKYISHVYYQGLDGTLTAIGATSITLPELKTSGTITAINVNDQAGSYEVKIREPLKTPVEHLERQIYL